MGSVIPLGVLVYCSSWATCHMISCVSKRLMLLMLLRPLHGSPLLVFSLLRPLVLLTLVARSFCTAPAFLLSTSGLNLRDVFLWPNSAGGIPCSVLHLSMHLNGTLSATNSLLHVWSLLIHLFPRYYVVTSMLFLTEPKIVGALILLSLSLRALSHWSYFSGVLCFGSLAPSPSRSSRLHLAETRWFLVLPHRPYWLPVYLASSCVFPFYCSMSLVLWSRCRFFQLLYPWIFSLWPRQMETECFHPQGSCLFSNC